MARPSINKATFDGLMRSINEKRRNQGMSPDEAVAEAMIDLTLSRLLRCLAYVAIEEGYDWHQDKVGDHANPEDGDTIGETLALILHEYITDFVLGDQN